MQLETADDFFAWLKRHPDTGVGLFSRISRDVGLQLIGSGAANYLSFGAYCDPDSWSYQPQKHNHLARSGYYRMTQEGRAELMKFDQQLIEEHVKHSWFYLYEGGKHPYKGETQPNYTPHSLRYTWAKAPRGALGHWVKVRDGKISKYQIITPTAWNASPKDSQDRPGHWEKSVMGLKLDNADDPLEIGHIVRSHDACLVCTVHMLDPLDRDKPARKESYPV